MPLTQLVECSPPKTAGVTKLHPARHQLESFPWHGPIGLIICWLNHPRVFYWLLIGSTNNADEFLITHLTGKNEKALTGRRDLLTTHVTKEGDTRDFEGRCLVECGTWEKDSGLSCSCGFRGAEVFCWIHISMMVNHEQSQPCTDTKGDGCLCVQLRLLSWV